MEHVEFIKLVESAVNKLEAQGAFSRGNFNNRCYYLRDDRCCIVGHMMPDDQTRVSADDCDDTSIVYLYDHDFPWATQFNYKQIEQLEVLQSLHDCGYILEEAISGMRKYLDTIKGG